MNVLQNLVELSNSMAYDSIYRNLAKTILENMDQLNNCTIYDLADLTNSSRTTLWRMIQKLGYSSFSDFRFALQSAAKQYTYYNRLLPSESCQSPDAIIKKTNTELKESAKILKECVNPKLLDELVNELSLSGKVRFYTPFRLAVIYSLQINLSKSGIDTGYYCLLPEMIKNAEELDSNSIVIINTLEYAETLNMEQVFKTIKEKGAKIWLAGSSRTQFAAYADRILLNKDAPPTCWMIAYESFLVMISEYYRNKYIK